MSTQIPDDEISTAIVEHQLSLSATLLRCLLRQLAVALPLARDTPEAIAAEDHQAARELFFAMRPRDPEEAAAAVRAVTAHFAAMDLHARASRPGLGDETVMRLRTRANASARAANLRRGKAERPPKPAREAPAESPPTEPRPVPQLYQFRPRDRFGKPIPLWKSEEMTKAQRRATYAPKYDAEIEGAALADEETMIAEQKALDAQSVPPAAT
jgi:hypothetical protein